MHSFISGRSVETNLSVLLNSVACDINVKTQTDVIYTDFKKRSTLLIADFCFINSNYLVFQVICYTGFNLTFFVACKGL